MNYWSGFGFSFFENRTNISGAATLNSSYLCTISPSQFFVVSYIDTQILSEYLGDYFYHSFDSEEIKTNPVDQTTIDKLPKKLAIQSDCNNSCVICMDNYKLDQIICELPCKHIYHSECIIQWMKCKNTCPLCVSKIN
jgi:hypothetical protein